MIEDKHVGGHPSLRELRLKAGKSQLQVAIEVGVSPQAVIGWEKGAVPHLDKAVRLARSLGLTLDELCLSYGMEPPKQETQTQSA